MSWSVEAQTAFDNLKKTLTEALVLAYADFSESFLLSTDASHHGLGAVLSQVQKGKERVIAYASHLRLPVDVGLGVMQEKPNHGLVGWVQDHHKKLSYAYNLAQEKIANAAEQAKRCSTEWPVLPLY